MGGALKLKGFQQAAMQQRQAMMKSAAAGGGVPKQEKSKDIKKKKKDKDKHKDRKDRKDRKKHKKHKKSKHARERRDRDILSSSDEVQNEEGPATQKMEKLIASAQMPEEDEESKDEIQPAQQTVAEVERVVMTPAERRFKEIQMQRMKKQIEKSLEKGHREKIEQFNEKNQFLNLVSLDEKFLFLLICDCFPITPLILRF